MKNYITLLKEGLNLLNIDLKYAEKLEIYIEKLIEYGTHTNIIGTLDRKEIVIKHIFDSLAIVPHFEILKKKLDIADIGSGAGLPGIPLAIVTNNNITCIESKKKKTKFLFDVKKKLDLTNLNIQDKNIAECKLKFDIITARAFSNITKIITITKSIKKANSRYYLFKGKKETIDLEFKSMQDIKSKIPKSSIEKILKNKKIISLEVPFLDSKYDRNLVIF